MSPIFAGQALRVATTVPFFLVIERDFLGAGEEGHFHAKLFLRVFDGVFAQRGVGLHDLEFFRLELAGLEQDAVGDADLADIMERRRLEQQFDLVRRQVGGKARVALQLLGQRLDVELGAADMVAGVVVARFRQRSHGQNRDILDRHDLAGALAHFLFQIDILVAQKIRAGLDVQLGLDARQHDGRRDRFGDVVGRAHLEALLLVFGAAHRGQKDDRNVAGRRIVLEFLADIIAGQTGHHDVEQNQVWRAVAAHDLERLLAIVGYLDLVQVLEQAGHQRKIVRCVVDHQHGGFFREVECVKHDQYPP